MNFPEKHVGLTKDLLEKIDKHLIAEWLLNEGYYPEQYILPPTFKVTGFVLQNEPFINDLNDPPRKKLINISYPKSMITSRVFGIQYPHHYHDIVYYLLNDWENIIHHLFHPDIEIYSYSFPIPVNRRAIGELSPLRSGRMIYEWIEMAEKDLVVESHKFKNIIRTDITNFYNSIYTHSIGWALHGREESFADKQNILTGNKIDRLVQYANDSRTNGIPVGSAVSDLIAEIILAKIDRDVSIKLKTLRIEFIGTRFKDDYRILSKSEDESKIILKCLAEELCNFNLLINEHKTIILLLPEGLYRQHDREYFPFSMKKLHSIPYKRFEHTLLKVLDIHKCFPGTSLIEKFLCELLDDNYNLKIKFSNNSSTCEKQIYKLFSLLLLLKRESEKILCHVLAIIECIYEKYTKRYHLKEYLKNLFIIEINNSIKKNSEFEIVWYVFFSRYLRLGIEFDKYIGNDRNYSLFLKSILQSKQRIFSDSDVDLFIRPKDCKKVKLAKHVSVFDRSKD